MDLTDRQYAILYGTLLGDGYISKLDYGYATYYRFEVEHSINDKEYVEWLYDELRDIFNVPPRRRERYSKFGSRGVKSVTLSLYSKMDKLFEQLRNETYSDGVKTVTWQWLNKLTPLSLAVWYMDDGSYHINRFTIEISTYSYSLDEHHLMQEYFQNSWNIRPSIAKRGSGRSKRYYLYFPRDEAKKFLMIVAPYIHPCMSRKLPLGWDKVDRLPPNFHLRLEPGLSAQTKEQLIIDNLLQFYDDIGRPNKFPILLYHQTPGTYSFKAVTSVFGCWEKALVRAGLPVEFM